MQKPKGYDDVKPYVQQERLPAGGYVLKIMKAEEVKYDWGSVLLISFDVAEGEYKDFFANNYRNQQMEDKKWKGTFRLNVPSGDGTDKDNNAARRFKTNMNMVEDSNPNFHWDWDETKLKGLLVGAVFNNKEYEFNGRHGFYTNCHHFETVENIQNEKFKVPDDTLLNGKTKSAINVDDYEEITDDGDLPF